MNDWDEESVLVSYVEFVHGANGKIPPTIRLYLANEEPRELGGEGVYFQILKRKFKVIAGGMHREFGSTPIPGRDQASHCLKPYMIEGALKIMKSIPDYCGKVFKTLSIFDICKVAFDEFVSSTRIYMTGTDQSFF